MSHKSVLKNYFAMMSLVCVSILFLNKFIVITLFLSYKILIKNEEYEF